MQNDKISINSIGDFKKRFGSMIGTFVKKHGINQKYLEAYVYCESTSGSGFFRDGRLLIRFENYTFIDEANKLGSNLSYDLVKYNPNNYEDEHYRKNTNSDWISIHDTPNTRYASLEWAKSLNREAAYRSISMGFPQIMGFNYAMLGYESAEQMYNAFSSGYTGQINGFFAFVQNDHNGAIINALKNNDARKAIALYNGSGNVEAYLGKFDKYMNC